MEVRVTVKVAALERPKPEPLPGEANAQAIPGGQS
jgi:hypothetical protein